MQGGCGEPSRGRLAQTNRAGDAPAHSSGVSTTCDRCVSTCLLKFPHRRRTWRARAANSCRPSGKPGADAACSQPTRLWKAQRLARKSAHTERAWGYEGRTCSASEAFGSRRSSSESVLDIFARKQHHVQSEIYVQSRRYRTCARCFVRPRRRAQEKFFCHTRTGPSGGSSAGRSPPISEREGRERCTKRRRQRARAPFCFLQF